MSVAKRIILFLIVNMAVMATISIIMNIFGIGNYLTAEGIDYTSLMIFCLLWGMGGSFISLLMSKFLVTRMMGVKKIDINTATGIQRELVDMVRRLSTMSNIPMPEVGIYDSPEINAFATGASKKSSLVAVSSGLLNKMTSAEVEGVIGHEISHVANGDMVTLTLIQGIVNAFSMFLSRIISFFISQMVKEEMERIVRFALTILFDIVFTMLGSFIVCYFSRIREYKADADSARIAGKDKMIAALRKLQSTVAIEDKRGESIAAFKISSSKKVMMLLSTHPSLDDRIKALEKFVR